jgi:hypothetical protein
LLLINNNKCPFQYQSIQCDQQVLCLLAPQGVIRLICLIIAHLSHPWRVGLCVCMLAMCYNVPYGNALKDLKYAIEHRECPRIIYCELYNKDKLIHKVRSNNYGHAEFYMIQHLNRIKRRNKKKFFKILKGSYMLLSRFKPNGIVDDSKSCYYCSELLRKFSRDNDIDIPIIWTTKDNSVEKTMISKIDGIFFSRGTMRLFSKERKKRAMQITLGYVKRPFNF